MFVLRRIQITSGLLVVNSTMDTTDTLDAPAWSSATTYGKFDRAREPDDFFSMNWVSTAAGNTDHDPSLRETYVDENGKSVLWWEPQFYRARDRMFGSVPEVQAASSNTDDKIDIEFTLSESITDLALINVDAESAQLIVTENTGSTEVYNETVDLTDYSAISSSYDYFFTPSRKITDYVFRNIPQYADATYRVIVDNSVSTDPARCGPIIAGPSVTLGDSLYGIDIGIKDFSRLVQNSGVSTIVEELQSRTMDVKVFITKGNEEAVLAVMREQLNKPTVWQADETDGATLVYGYFTRARLLYTTPAGSMYNISIQGIQR